MQLLKQSQCKQLLINIFKTVFRNRVQANHTDSKQRAAPPPTMPLKPFSELKGYRKNRRCSKKRFPLTRNRHTEQRQRKPTRGRKEEKLRSGKGATTYQ